MVIGNVIMIVSSILLYFGTRIIAPDMQWLRYACFCVILCIICYRIHIPDSLYPFRTDLSDKRSETAPDVYYFNTIASLIGMGLVQFLAPILGDRLGGYNSAKLF